MKCLMLFHSKYGQTEKIARRISDALHARQITVVVHDVGYLEKSISVEPYDLVVIGAPIYAVGHSKQLAHFVREHYAELLSRTTAFFSVSLSAAGNESQRADATQCLNQFLEQTNWEPSFARIFAGALPYRKYNWLTRWLMKRVVRKSGGDTDTSKNYEYTDWSEVDQFAIELSDAVLAGNESPDNSDSARPERVTQDGLRAR